MRTEQELYAIHKILKKHLIKAFELKFEICLAIARKMIRLDYHTFDLEQNLDELFANIEEDIVTIKIDTSTPQKVYKEIISAIYRVSRLKSTIKDTERFTKEQRLLLLIDIHFYKHYFGLSQVQIKDKLESSEEIVDVLEKTIDSKDIHDYIKMANEMREIVNYISTEQYLQY